MFAETFIIITQLVGTLLMGADYFLPEKTHKQINVSMIDDVKKEYEIADYDYSIQRKLMMRSIPFIGIGILVLISIRLIIDTTTGTTEPIIMAVGFVVSMAMLFFGFYIVGIALRVGVIPMIPVLSKKFFYFYLSICPKGPLAGLGFIVLVSSFLMRLTNEFIA